jgi:hypothetical protein
VTTSTLTVTEFVLARIAEDEANIEGDWSAGDGGLHIISTTMHRRVLAQCAAMRKIVEEYAGEIARGPAGKRDDFVARHGGILDAYRVAVEALASIWSDHPDYRQEWRA